MFYIAVIDNFHIISVVCAKKVEDDIDNKEHVDGLVCVICPALSVSAVESEQVRRQHTRHYHQPRVKNIISVLLTMFLSDHSMFLLSNLGRSSTFSWGIH